jgi:hypothetical protein
VDGGPGHCESWILTYRLRFATNLITQSWIFSLRNDRLISDSDYEGGFIILAFPDWMADLFMDIWHATGLHL